MLGRRLGSYRIEREIGRGGMGAVYEASRADNEFNKRAAIKLVKRGMDTDFILRASARNDRSSPHSIIRTSRVCSTAVRPTTVCPIS